MRSTTTTTAPAGWWGTASSPATRRNCWETSQRDRRRNNPGKCGRDLGYSEDLTKRAKKTSMNSVPDYETEPRKSGCEWLYLKGCYSVIRSKFYRQRRRLLWARTIMYVPPSHIIVCLVLRYSVSTHTRLARTKETPLPYWILQMMEWGQKVGSQTDQLCENGLDGLESPDQSQANTT